MKIPFQIFFALYVSFHFSVYSFAQTGIIKQVKLTQFQLQSSELIDAKGEVISRFGYSSKAYWFPVSVPSTILTGQVANCVYPDPYSGMNNMLIPDACDEFNKTYISMEIRNCFLKWEIHPIKIGEVMRPTCLLQ